ncbi:MAG: hypothetical protein IT384_24710 [Deltaproteobacteria bacterium]|nr:hypothetical protein [Deltaproteobacteria bacterium]
MLNRPAIWLAILGAWGCSDGAAPQVEVPSAHDFGLVRLDLSARRTFAPLAPLAELAGEPLLMTANLSGTDSDRFRVFLPANVDGPFQLQGGETIEVEYRPCAEAQAAAADPWSFDFRRCSRSPAAAELQLLWGEGEHASVALTGAPFGSIPHLAATPTSAAARLGAAVEIAISRDGDLPAGLLAIDVDGAADGLVTARAGVVPREMASGEPVSLIIETSSRAEPGRRGVVVLDTQYERLAIPWTVVPPPRIEVTPNPVVLSLSATCAPERELSLRLVGVGEESVAEVEAVRAGGSPLPPEDQELFVGDCEQPRCPLTVRLCNPARDGCPSQAALTLRYQNRDGSNGDTGGLLFRAPDGSLLTTVAVLVPSSTCSAPVAAIELLTVPACMDQIVALTAGGSEAGGWRCATSTLTYLWELKFTPGIAPSLLGASSVDVSFLPRMQDGQVVGSYVMGLEVRNACGGIDQASMVFRVNDCP